MPKPKERKTFFATDDFWARLQAFADSKAKTAGVPVSMNAAAMFILENALVAWEREHESDVTKCATG